MDGRCKIWEHVCDNLCNVINRFGLHEIQERHATDVRQFVKRAPSSPSRLTQSIIYSKSMFYILMWTRYNIKCLKFMFKPRKGRLARPSLSRFLSCKRERYRVHNRRVHHPGGLNWDQRHVPIKVRPLALCSASYRMGILTKNNMLTKYSMSNQRATHKSRQLFGLVYWRKMLRPPGHPYSDAPRTASSR